MKKVFLTLFLAATLTLAQEGSGGLLAFGSGDNVIGIAYTINNLGANHGANAGGLMIAWDHGAGFSNMFSFGAEFNIWDNDWKIADVEYSRRYMTPLFRFAFHPFGIPALDGKVRVARVLNPYLVIAAGPSFVWKDYTAAGVKSDTEINTEFLVDIRPGVRWFFNPRFNLWAEGGLSPLGDGNFFAIGAGVKF